MPPEDKDAALFPRRFDGRWAMIHRPSPLRGGAHMWISFSPDLRHWGDHTLLLEARDGAWWDAGKIGLGPPPLETAAGLARDVSRRPSDIRRPDLPDGPRPARPRRTRGSCCIRPTSGCSAPRRHTRSPAMSAGSSSRAAGSSTPRPIACYLYYGAADTVDRPGHRPLQRGPRASSVHRLCPAQRPNLRPRRRALTGARSIRRSRPARFGFAC